jgi:hypothetical protein
MGKGKQTQQYPQVNAEGGNAQSRRKEKRDAKKKGTRIEKGTEDIDAYIRQQDDIGKKRMALLVKNAKKARYVFTATLPVGRVVPPPAWSIRGIGNLLPSETDCRAATPVFQLA